MKITAIKPQKRDENRVNISVDGKYRFSLNIYQLTDLGVKVGREYDEVEILALEQESQFGKVYTRALDYCLIRPHSSREVRDYLARKLRPVRQSDGGIKPGLSYELLDRVFNRLVEKGYIDDSTFADYWVKNRFIRKGVSRRRLISELMAKGVDRLIIDRVLQKSDRSDNQEIKKVIDKKRTRYSDEQKLIAYLARQGFGYDDIKKALAD